MSKRRAQISIEYLIVVSFVTFLVIGVLSLGYFYSSQAKDRIKFNQIAAFSNKVIGSAETVFSAGEPSRVVVNSYLPAGITGLDIIDNSLIFTVSTSSGVTKVSYPSNVPISGNLSFSEGVKIINVTAQTNGASLSG